MGFGDYDAAARMRDVIRRVAAETIQWLRPAYRYATVESVDVRGSSCMVVYPGETVSVRVRMGSTVPVVGQIVRINGAASDRFIEDAMGETPVVSADRDIVVKLYDGAAPETLIAVLDVSETRGWEDEFNEVGSGQFAVKVTDPNIADLLTGGNIARFELNGTMRFGIVLDRPDRDSAAALAQRMLYCTGDGVLSLWDRGVVLPELGVGRRSPEFRTMGFASSDYDHSAWTAAIETDGHPIPEGMLDTTAHWIWGVAPTGDSPPHPVGDNFLWKTFVLTDEADLRGFITADDGYELYLDGALLSSATQEFMWGRAQEFDLFLDAGVHYLAIRGINIDRPNTPASNFAEVILSIMTVTDGGASVDAVVVHTDDTWVCLPYPSPAPTMTPGKILRIFLEEVQALGPEYMTGVTLGCTDTLDSNGVPWNKELDVGWPVSTSLLEVIRTIVEQAADVWMNPVTFATEVYNKGTLGTDVSGTVSLVADENLKAAKHIGENAVCNVGLAKYHTGEWLLLARASSVEAVGARMAGLTIGTAPSVEAAERTVEAVFDDYANPIDTLTGTVITEGDSSDPYANFQPGDTVSASSRYDTLVPTLVTKLKVSESSVGTAAFTIEAQQDAA